MSLPISIGRFAAIWGIMAVAMSVSGVTRELVFKRRRYAIRLGSLDATGLDVAHVAGDIRGLSPKVVMRRVQVLAAAGLVLAVVACTSSPPSSSVSPAASAHGTIARVYYWRAKPGKVAEYTDYITKIAEPIDHEAQRRGAFISVTTFASRDTTTPWTHMRVFVLRDSAQLAGLSAALDAAGVALEPDSAKRRQRSQYGATLRDAMGSGTYEILP
jgi:hypothetical protein